jgi:hypothetical protein
MPARQQDDDFLSTLPDTSKTGKPYTSADKPRGRRTAATENDDFLESMTDTTGQKTYSAADAGSNDSYSLYPGVKIVGHNAAGQPILAPEGPPQPTGSAARRFLSSAVQAIKQPLVGMYHAATDPARTDEEKEILGDPWSGRIGLIANRLIAQPMTSEGHKAKEEFNQGNYSLAAGHGLAAILPGIGPAAAAMGEQVGTQIGTGDYAGAAGTLAGNAAMYAAPEGLGRLARSELITRSIPHGQITRLIRPAAADLKFGKDPAAAILQEKLVGNNLEQLGDRVYDRLHEVGKQIDAEAQKPVNARKVVDVSGALKPLDDAMQEAAQAGDGDLFGKLQAVRDELANNWHQFRRANGQVVLRKTGPRNLRMSPYEALKFKRQIGDRIRWTQDPLDGLANKALGDSYSQVKGAVNAQVPGLARLNERYSNLVGAGKAIERRLPIEARNAHWSLTDVILGSSGHLGLAAARHVLRWPGVRTRTAAGLYNLPRVIPEHAALITAPATGAAASAEEDRRRLADQP